MKGNSVMNDATVFRENISTIRTCEKITFGSDGKVIKRETIGKPVNHDEDFWSANGKTINDSDEWDCEEAYKESCSTEQKQEIPEHIVTELFEWVIDEIGDFCSLRLETLLESYSSQKQLLSK